jgi:large subunit ribosomal protein L9
MYGSVSIGDIVHLLKDQLSIVVEKRFIQLPHPIKEVGVHAVKVKLKEGISSNFTLKVVADVPPEQQAAESKKAAPAA